MGYVKRRADLIADGLLIPRWTDWDDLIDDQNKTLEQVELNDWIKSFGQDDDGHVFTEQGLFYSIDLDYKETI